MRKLFYNEPPEDQDMSKRPRRNHAPAFKAKVALESQKGDQKIGFHIFEAHDSSNRLNLGGFYQKNMGLSRNIMNNIKILPVDNSEFLAKKRRRK